MPFITKVHSNPIRRFIKELFCMHQYELTKPAFYEYYDDKCRKLTFYGRWAVCVKCGYTKFIQEMVNK